VKKVHTRKGIWLVPAWVAASIVILYTSKTISRSMMKDLTAEAVDYFTQQDQLSREARERQRNA
jgi:hypothetical protein